MKVIAWIFLIILTLIAVLAVGMGILSHKRAAEREERTIYYQQQNVIYKEQIERLCVFPSGYAPTVSGKMFNLTKYNLALKDTLFDVKKEVVYGAWHYESIDEQRGGTFRELRPNGIRYKVIDNQCYVSDVILPLTFDHQSYKISVGGVDWKSYEDNGGVQYSEDFYAYICLRKLCEGKPSIYVPLTKSSDTDFRKPKKNRDFFEDKRFPDIIFYADFNHTEKRNSGKKYSDYSVYMQHKFIKQSGGRYYTLEMHLPSILGSQGTPPFFTSSVFLDELKPNRTFHRRLSGGVEFSFYFNGGSIEPESFTTNVLPVMTEFMQALQAYPQQFISDREPQ